jgi:YD repeat-containing protein
VLGRVLGLVIVAKRPAEILADLRDAARAQGGCGAWVPGATQYGYDTPGNLTSIQPPTLATGTGTQPGNTSVAYDAISRPCVVTDGKGQKTKYGYDPLDRTTSITKYAAGATSSGCTVTGTVAGTVTLTYDVDGNLTQRVDPNGTSTFTYTKLNRLASQAYPGGRTNTYTYDQVGNSRRSPTPAAPSPTPTTSTTCWRRWPTRAGAARLRRRRCARRSGSTTTATARRRPTRTGPCSPATTTRPAG